MDSWEILAEIWNLQKKKKEWYSGNKIYDIWNEKKHEWVKNTLEFAKTKTVTLKSVKPQWYGTIINGLRYMSSESQRKDRNNPK